MTHPMIEEAARAIDPRAYRAWQSMYDFCISQGDSEAEAKRHADASEGENIKKAEAAATIACRIAIKAAGQAMTDEVEEHAQLGGEIWVVERLQARLHALSEQIGEA